MALYKHTVTVEHFSMPNHLSDPPPVPELIQDRATAENLVFEVEKLLSSPQHYQSMHQALAKLAPELSRDSGELACNAIMGLLEQVKIASSAQTA